MPSEHARVSPSALSRVLRCPGSVAALEQHDERRDSFFAAEGTAAHEVRESCLRYGLMPEDFLGQKITADGFEIEVSDEMVVALTPGIEWVREQAEAGELYVEERVRFDEFMPGMFGTLDGGVVRPDRIVVDDLKYGAGVPVSTERNEQLMCYALGFWYNIARQKTDATDFLIHIDQPRAKGGGGEWWTTLDELLEYEATLRDLFAKLFPDIPKDWVGTDPWQWPINADLPFAAGEKQCQFCDLKGECDTLAEHNLAIMQMVFDDLDDEEIEMPDAEGFNRKRRCKIALNEELIRKWLKAVSARVLEDALHGQPTPGVKAVAGRKGDRYWKSPELAEKRMSKLLPRSKMFSEPKLISPAAVEKLIPSNRFPARLAALIDQDDGRPVLVSEDDKRSAMSIADKFDDL